MVRHIVHRIRHFLSVKRVFEKLDEESRKNEFYFILGIIVSLAGNFIVEVIADSLRNLNLLLYWVIFILSILFFALIINWFYEDYFKQRDKKKAESRKNPKTN